MNPKKNSVIEIYSFTDSTRSFSIIYDFQIHKGDFGKLYAARFEVWFKPDTAAQERKLVAENHIIEEWQHLQRMDRNQFGLRI